MNDPRHAPEAADPSPRVIRLAPAALRAAVARALTARGVPSPVAEVEAELMVEADLMGVPSHGVLMLPRLLSALDDGRATASPDVRVVSDRGAACCVDGDLGPGRYASTLAMTHAITRARTHGIGLCALVRSTHWGRAFPYACQAARQGLMGLCATNAIPTLAAGGAARAVLGNNPIAIAAPRGQGADPIVLDMAMSQAALGKVGTYQREGRDVPEGWGFTARGEAASDAAAILSSGLLAPMGGHKGLGLALMVELLTAALTGGPLGHEIVARDRTGLDPGATKLFVAIDIAAFGGQPAFADRVETLLAFLRDEAPGQLAPGERGWAERARNLVAGVPLHEAIVSQLRAAGVVLGSRPCPGRSLEPGLHPS